MKELNLTDFRKRAEGSGLYRSLEELARDDEFIAGVEREFPQQALPLERGVDRRDFVKLMSSSLALAGLAACNRPAEKIVPYISQPENLIPGRPLYFATALALGGVGAGVLVESHMGRPTKIEGNPDHPSSLGGSDAMMQAAILGLYDPDRAQVVRHLGEISTWSAFLAALQPVLKNAKADGAGLRLLTQTITSPTLGAQIQQLLAAVPGMEWHQWEAVSRDNVREGLRMAFGGYANAVYHFDKANVVVSLDADFLATGPGHLRYARDFTSRRKVRQGQAVSMNRLYSFDCGASSTGSLADHRWPVRPREIEDIAREIATELSVATAGVATAAPGVVGARSGRRYTAIAKDLEANRGASIVIAGDDQPPIVHALVMALNQALGNIGSTITITDPIEVAPVNHLESLRKLVTDINAGAVKALVMLGGNPVYDAPADFNFGHALNKVLFRAQLSPYYDETSMLVHWHVPEVHALEGWSDVRGHDGTVSIVQPLIAPLYNGRSPHEVLGALIGGLDQSPYDTVRAYWMARVATPAPGVAPAAPSTSLRAGSAAAATQGFEKSWRKWLHDGQIAGSALPAKGLSVVGSQSSTTDNRPPTTSLELHIRPDPNIHDGRFANNGWLQELPKPQTKICWENVALISPKTASDIGYDDKTRDALVNERSTMRADVTYRGRKVRVPLWVMPGHPDGVITVYLGYGRTYGGKVAGPDVGVDIYPVRFSDAMSGDAGAEIALVRGEDAYPVACTQEHQSINPKDMFGQEREIIRAATFAEYQRDPHLGHKEEAHGHDSMYPPYKYEGHAWAMVIDTSVCTGCNGCVMACQAENNIAIVGKEEVHREREMHWLRIDRYFRGEPANPEVFHQPVPCMQCENAPCEPVCPVEATSHSSEGLNDMTYNRCVGTRYCSNNCPYKVRRFNFFHYSDYDTPALKPMRNPDVTIRTRGVMEKCTYCVQRVNEAKIEAEKRGGNQRVRDGEVTTACAQACPTEAIVFGDKNDPNSRVAKLKEEPSHYTLLEELNTRPRTTYLGTIRNVNPEIKS
jgi:MoCo/4Fe-4S cofactor protein with predicted Tat translocation signal